MFKIDIDSCKRKKNETHLFVYLIYINVKLKLQNSLLKIDYNLVANRHDLQLNKINIMIVEICFIKINLPVFKIISVCIIGFIF